MYVKLYCIIHSIFYSIFFYFSLFYSILFYSILFYFSLFYSILFYFGLFYSILFYSILFYFSLFYSILFYSILCSSILLYSILFYSNQVYSIKFIAKNVLTMHCLPFQIQFNSSLCLHHFLFQFPEHFSSATGKFVFQRKTTYFLLQVYLPCILIVMVSWASFWIHEEAVPARAAICVTTILTIITMLGVVNVNMPKVSYVKAVDFYLFISFLMVFLSLLEYIVVLNFQMFCKKRRDRKNHEYSNNNKVRF